eukprot:gb/GEZN01006644.1/.p1 GENE.gb/GEZN01006644.1/~~gb/GEZN01006644.1/.p1  ORF type:complete len:534 (+),score=69.66 gb/GEZN01006644.1/:115-1602(+)
MQASSYTLREPLLGAVVGSVVGSAEKDSPSPVRASGRRSRATSESSRRPSVANELAEARRTSRGFSRSGSLRVGLPIRPERTLNHSTFSQSSAQLLHRHPSLNFAEKDVQTTCRELRVCSEQGLSSAEAQARLEKLGRNELETKAPPTFWEVFIDQFRDVVVLILLVGACISIALGEWAAGIAILVIVFFNAFLGVKMELSATAALLDLEHANPDYSQVVRDSLVQTVPTYSLVPGDIVVLTLGKRIPADLRLTESAGLECNEMPLTGESVPTKKDANWKAILPSQPEPADPLFLGSHHGALEGKEVEVTEISDSAADDEEAQNATRESSHEEELNPRNLVFMGCMVETGNGKGVVVHTGMRTAMGSIQRQLSLADEDISPLAQKLTQLGAILGFASTAISLVVLLLMRLVLHNTWLDALLVAVSLTVAAVPEGLPVCVTIALAVGMRTMATCHRAQILRLKSVETLGSASVICSDKTGTLTKGEMTAVAVSEAG